MRLQSQAEKYKTRIMFARECECVCVLFPPHVRAGGYRKLNPEDCGRSEVEQAIQWKAL